MKIFVTLVFLISAGLVSASAVCCTRTVCEAWKYQADFPLRFMLLAKELGAHSINVAPYPKSVAEIDTKWGVK